MEKYVARLENVERRLPAKGRRIVERVRALAGGVLEIPELELGVLKRGGRYQGLERTVFRRNFYS